VAWYNDIANFAKSTFFKAKNFTVKHSPEIMFIAGSATIVAGVGFAIKKSWEPSEGVVAVNNDIKKLKDFAAENVSDEEGSTYTTADYKKDMHALMPRAIGAYTFNYLPTEVCIIIGLLLQYKSNMQYKARAISAVAVASGIMVRYQTLQQRIRDRFGDDVLYELLNDIQPEPIAVMEDGTEVLPKPPEKPLLDLDDTCRFFDERSVHYDKSADANVLYIQLMEEQFNSLLHITDQISFNQACGKLDLPKDYTPVTLPGTNKTVYKGDIIGWKADKNVTHKIVISIMDMGDYVKKYNPRTEIVDDNMYDGDATLFLRFNCTDILVDSIAV